MMKSDFIIEKKALVKEQVLVFYEIPLMFVCVESEDTNKKYVALCYDEENYNYLIVETTLSKIIDLLDKKITMANFFVEAEKKWIVETSDCVENDSVKAIDRFDEDILPIENTYYEILDNDVKLYLKKIKDELNPYIVNDTVITKEFETINYSSLFVLDIDEDSFINENKYITSQNRGVVKCVA